MYFWKSRLQLSMIYYLYCWKIQNLKKNALLTNKFLTDNDKSSVIQTDNLLKSSTDWSDTRITTNSVNRLWSGYVLEGLIIWVHYLFTQLELKIGRAIDRLYFVVRIFRDLSKAFDWVKHRLLIEKLEFYILRGPAMEWICSYLSKRFQCVRINNNIRGCSSIK